MKQVTDKDKGIQCEMCENWHHAVCEGISDEAYSMIGRLETIHWFCRRCNNGIVKVLKTVGRLSEKVDKIETIVDFYKKENEMELRKVYNKIEQVNSSLRNLVENKLAHEVDDKIVSFRDIVKQQLADEVKDSVGETRNYEKRS